MNRTALFLSALLLVATPCAARDYYLLESDVPSVSGTTYMEARRMLLRTIYREIREVRGEMLLYDQTETYFEDGTLSDGRVAVLIANPRALHGFLASAKKVAPHATVAVHLEAFDRPFFQNWLPVDRWPWPKRFGARQTVRVTLDELYRIRKAPAAIKRTGFGALLRRAWRQTGEDPTSSDSDRAKDDVGSIQARMWLDFGGLPLVDGSTGGSPSEERVDSDHADLVLGRKKTPLEKWNSVLGRYEEPMELDDAQAHLLTQALPNALESPSRGEAWEEAARLRGDGYAELLGAEHALGSGARRGAISRIPGD